MRRRSVFVALDMIFLLGVGVVGIWYVNSNQIAIRGTTYLHYTPLPDDKIVCIYFDDGLKSQLNAVPYLDAYGYKANLAIIANYTAPQHPIYLSWNQIKSLGDKGYDIQCHTMNHKDLDALSNSELETEIVYSKQIFKSQGYMANTLVYPSGLGYKNATVRRLVESNYSNARTVFGSAWNLTELAS